MSQWASGYERNKCQAERKDTGIRQLGGTYIPEHVFAKLNEFSFGKSSVFIEPTCSKEIVGERCPFSTVIR